MVKGCPVEKEFSRNIGVMRVMEYEKSEKRSRRRKVEGCLYPLVRDKDTWHMCMGT